MPIDVSNLTQAAKNIQTFSPKFFSAKLTGSGKNQGVLNQNVNPGSLTHFQSMTGTHLTSRKRHYTNGATSVYELPFNILTHAMWDYMKTYVPDDAIRSARVNIGNMVTLANCQIYLDMTVHSIVMDETRNPNGIGYSRKISPCYQIFLYFESSTGTPAYERMSYSSLYKIVNEVKAGKNIYTYTFTTNPRETFEDIRYMLADQLGLYVDNVMLQDYLVDYSLYENVCRESQIWQMTCDKYLAQILANVKNTNDSVILNNTAAMLVALEQYPIPLDLYRPIYQSVAANFPTDVALTLCKQNLNLLLNDTLYALNSKRNQLSTIPNPNVPVQTKIPLSNEQLAAISSQNPLVLVQSGAGTGKALPLDTPILTPTGWTTMGELKVGDEVIGSNGKPCHVLRIHEQGLKPGYHITFRDGSEVDCCGEHLWTVITKDKNGGKERRSTITTDHWINSYHKTHSYLPIVEPVEYAFGEKELPIDPYLLGALLADGCLVTNSIQYTKSETDVYKETQKAAARDGYEMYDTTVETSTAKQWRFKHPDDKEHYSKLKTTLRELGLLVKSHDKFIPETYKTSSINQRKSLINGLFDGDGNVRTGRGYARFNTASNQMANDVLQLLWSLGLNATKQKQPHKKGNYWSVNLLDQNWNPFIASEHKNKVTGSVRPMRRGIKYAEHIDPVPMRCIEVDAPDKLYVTKNFIVTHNSTVILNRINHMVNAGVNPEDITVISFTNAAADHIKEEQSLVHSMTACAMINTIYKANFPTHDLNTMESLASTLRALYPNVTTDPKHKLAHRFAEHITAMDSNRSNNKQESNPQTRMNNFIEKNLADVLQILDEVGQTTLELQIIICYQLIGQLQEPPEIQTKYLIIDEVQDNSVFEFIYFLRYAEKHDASLFMVGDCSQTLYEFRASNPKALNTLEGSGVFEIHRLDINYRSNQEILDFANITLARIEANQYANIQLRSNMLTRVTEKSFKDKIQLKAYQCSKKAGEFNTILPQIITNDLKAYLDDKIAKHEQVAFLAYPRVQVSIIQATLRDAYPNANIVSIMSDKQHGTTLFTRFISEYWNEVKFAPTPDLDVIIGDLIASKLRYLLSRDTDENRKAAFNQIGKWKLENAGHIRSWANQYMHGVITLDQLLNNTMQNMIDFEVKTNAISQLLTSQRNNDRKNEQDMKNADFIMSTIHSAKGREFPHCVIIYKDTTDMSEPDKRAYYVALTRAMKTEFVVAYDTYANPDIEGQYNMVIGALHEADALTAKNQNTNPNSPIVTVVPETPNDDD